VRGRVAPFDPTFFEKSTLFWPIARAAAAFAAFPDWPAVAEYDAAVAHRAKIAFREQPRKQRGRRTSAVGPRDLYDGRIVEEGWVPTRPASWHDYLNMLVWASFPEAKRQLHARQHRAQTARLGGPVMALPNARTREQDALALMDEGGVVVLCRAGAEDDLRRALASRRAGPLFASGAARGLIFGHAVYEGLVLGRDDGWAAAHVTSCDADPRAEPEELVRAADVALAAELARQGSFESPAALARVDLSLLHERADPLGQTAMG
jgi:hypothetical protein